MSIKTKKCKIFSGKNHTKMPKEFLNRTDTAVVFPQQPCDEDKGKPIPHTYFRANIIIHLYMYAHKWKLIVQYM